MRGITTDPAGQGGLRLADDLPEPSPAPGEVVLAVRAFSINAGEISLVEQRPDGWRPGQDAGPVTRMAAEPGCAAAPDRPAPAPRTAATRALWRGPGKQVPLALR